MKFKACALTNFGSYDHLEFDFSNLSLSLVYGATGSGKSTLEDAPCWVLYGLTAKDGNVDEVRSWNAPESPTEGSIEVELPDTTIFVTRIRGKSNENDLYWTEASRPEEKVRGKDITETQKLLEERLGCSSELYLTGAYFSEFSRTGTFFMDKAKNRRELFDKIASLDLPILLAEKTSEARKDAKVRLKGLEASHAKVSGRIEQLNLSTKDVANRMEAWKAQHIALLHELQVRKDNFELEKESKIAALVTRHDRFEVDKSQKIEDALSKIHNLEKKIKPDEHFLEAEKCPTCGSTNASCQEDRLKNNQYIQKRDSLVDGLSVIHFMENPYVAQLKQAREAENHYDAQIEAEEKKVNPFAAQLVQLTNAATSLVEQETTLQQQIQAVESRIASLNTLYDLSFELRGRLLNKAIKDIEAQTNRYLESYFDSEIRVGFVLDGADNLEVEIWKSGHACVYRQLSKGQRSLLRLAFVVSVMAAASNKAGVHFSNLFFDEALDGIDSNLKIKAFRLFEELSLSHESILLIDHAPEFQSLFANKFYVTISEDISHIEKENE